jgi:centromeric protein E
VKDLLCPSAGDLAIHESKSRGGAYVGAVERIVRSANEVMALLEQGEANRHYGRTDMNDFSSRSHTILRLLIESNPTSDAAAASVDAEVERFMLASPGRAGNNASARAKKAGKPRVKVSLLNFVDRE